MVLPLASAVLPRTGIRSYGFQRSAEHTHNGIDIGAKEGAPVRAAAAGRVRHATSAWQQGFSGYGRVVVLEHAGGVWTLYAHLGEALVSPDEDVQEGDQIGTVGRTQYLASDHDSMLAPGSQHLHFEVAARPYPMPQEADRLDPVAWLEDGSRVTHDPDELLARLRGASGGGEFIALLAMLGGAMWLARRKGGS